MLLLLPRFCAYFSLQIIKTMINIWPHLNFFAPPSAVLSWLWPWGGQVGARTPGRKPWGRINTLFQPFKNVYLRKNLDQNMSKTLYFWKTTIKIAAASGIHPQTPGCYSRLLLQLCRCAFQALNAFYCYRKSAKEITANVLLSLLFAPIFISRSAILLVGAQKYFLPQGAGYPSYATGIWLKVSKKKKLPVFHTSSF